MTSVADFVTHRARHLDTAALPPGPRLPVPVQTALFLGLGNIVAPIWRRRYGDVFAVHVAPAGHGIVLSNPEHIREVFNGPADTFHAGEGNAILGPIMGEHSVLLLDEEEHRVARKRVMSAFRGETTASWRPVVADVAARDVATWPVDRPFAVHPHLNDVSLEVILRIVFGVSDDARLARMRPLLQRLVRIGPTILLGWVYPQLERIGPWRRFLRLKAAVDRLVYAEIAERRTVADLAERTDVLSKLLVAAPEQSDAELRDHLMTLLLAGHETTASTLAWTLHDLARTPDVLARARRAADEGDEDYLEAVVKESLRLRPVISEVARRLAKPVRVGGYDLPAGVVVFPSIKLVQLRPDLYDEPLAFRPERFLGVTPPPATWIPFGGGLRRCLGAALAMVEAVAVLRTVLTSVDIEPAGHAEPSRARNITQVPARGARLVTRPR
ncbi:Cytochrome P450 [Jatrophihabitans endophyticus]|uniref:Cytochrome P450 n=1 Tax=Jatrophihabitans endophyticus TaxID=1206085 RepID=A0A1M5IUT2_9ACTN|nr:cytochrome P450 [Jatrophihabitans endophyticus]SHG32077.1 Cytochrome P450 [Jatrophihabitans endophyticus]